MAKKTKKQLNTDLEDEFNNNLLPEDTIDHDQIIPEVDDLGQENEPTYIMGEIQVENNADEDEVVGVLPAVEDPEDVWIDDTVSTDDEDPFLDMEKDFDGDNPADYE